MNRNTKEKEKIGGQLTLISILVSWELCYQKLLFSTMFNFWISTYPDANMLIISFDTEIVTLKLLPFADTKI